MTLREAASSCITKYATFSGRSSREEYWKFTAAYVIALFGLAILYNITNWSIFGYLAAIVLLGSVIPFLSVGVRRLHDTGRPGTWMLIRLVPFAGDLIIFIYSIEDSQPFTNAYGPSPKPGLYPAMPWAGQMPPSPEGSPLATAPTPVDESDLPFYQARRKAALETSGRQRYESGEPSLDSHRVDDYFAYASGQKLPPNREQKPAFSFSTMSRKSIGIIAGGIAFALLVLGIFLGANSWRPSAQDSVQPAAPALQPVAEPALPPDTPTQQITPSPSPTVQAAVPTAAPPPVLPTKAAAPQPGDLGLASPLRPVDCTGKFIVFYHSSKVPATYAEDVQANLASHPGSKYLLTLGSCSSLNPMSNTGTMIYAVYGGPFDTLAQACVAASQFADEAYVKVLDNTTPPDQSVRPCS
ncbi:DUF805 domain-containing protein [Arthrobacter sp. 24S4-2]|uniref:DUF805 domain-containing protein n=1 Tax=Arthrobacter sp. 24S4-2 TaxID=2575374 RepID=UPI0010C77A83|nr:DUF805 domain-containing protein [Arthrobacter sp. 24S4-2]QCO97328.1 DUF805 domain-containing protein [Arthrobacter sp. 24S4-2]